MIVRVPDLKDEVRDLEFVEPSDRLNARLEAGHGPDDQRFVSDVSVCAEIYRTEHDVHFQGRIDGGVRATCARCLDEFERPLERDFRFVILPRAAATDDSDDDEGVDHYSGDDLDLSPLVQEQALLALDPVPLCTPDCRGLCPRCGANRNREECACAPRG